MKEILERQLQKLQISDKIGLFRLRGSSKKRDFLRYEIRKINILEEEYFVIAGTKIEPITCCVWNKKEEIIAKFEQAIGEKEIELSDLRLEENDPMEEIFSYVIPINGDENDVNEFNKKHGTNFKSTDWHYEQVFEKFVKTIDKVGDSGGWYLSDGIRIETRIVYEPENK